MGTRKIAELIIDIVLLFLGIGLYVSSQSIDPGNSMGIGGDFMPRVCTLLWIFISIGLLVTEIFTSNNHEKGITANIRAFFGTLILLFAYIYTLDDIGFIITSAIYMFIQMCIFVPAELRNKRNYLLFLVLSIIIPFAIDKLFVDVFSLILPTGIL